MSQSKVPGQAWVTVFAGTAINLCLGILYAWSVWKKALVNPELAGEVMTGIDAGWTYLTNSQAATPFSLCIIMFMLCMVPGGKIQDKLGPKACATIGGLCLAAGCIIAGLMKSYTGLIIGFGIMGGIGMGIGYAAPTPAALKWFGPHRRGLIAGLVVSGYGGAALYISPLARYLIEGYGITGSFIALGVIFALVVIVAGQLLNTPPAGYQPPAPPVEASAATAIATKVDWEPSQIVKTKAFFSLVIMFVLATQSGLLIIGNAAGLLSKAGSAVPFLVANAWILAAYGGITNAVGRVGTGVYSDRIGRTRAYAINCGVAALCMFSLPMIIASENILLLFIATGIGYWQYGGLLSLMPSFVADFFGGKNLGMNYGLVFIGWGLGAFMPKLGGIIQDATGSLDLAFYISGSLLLASVAIALLTRRPDDSHLLADAPTAKSEATADGLEERKAA
ncbi:L-lactate MFS transporter [Trichloromonas sp.]|uniref:L-lactate MFS transporter n=1 Tax=Trichloromonas sp. TaxID=3069249 RepID=UPI003D819C99